MEQQEKITLVNLGDGTFVSEELKSRLEAGDRTFELGEGITRTVEGRAFTDLGNGGPGFPGLR